MTIAFRALLGAAGSGEAPEPPTAYSVDFNGSTQHASIPSSLEFLITTNLTLEADCYPDAVNGNRSIICRFAVGSNSFILRIENGKLKLYCFIEGNWRSATGATTIPTGQWTHLAGVYDGSAIKVYVNGVEDGSTAQSGLINASGGVPLEIGGTTAVGGEFFDGKITNARVWSVNRSANLGAAVTGSESGLVVALEQDVQIGSGSTWNDKSQNGFDASLNNSPTWSTDVP